MPVSWGMSKRMVKLIPGTSGEFLEVIPKETKMEVAMVLVPRWMAREMEDVEVALVLTVAAVDIIG